MNREIKFRIWDNKTEEMQNPTDIFIHAVDGWVWNTDIDDGYEDCEVMQFTGLQDKYGKDIYEGDILDEKYRWLVVFEDGCFVAEAQIRSHINTGLLNEIISMRNVAGIPVEIIGNIFENPELLDD